MDSILALVAIGLVVVVTLTVGSFRIRRTTSDLLVASRTVSPSLNATAIGGEYLSAASFLGIAGLVMKYGVDMLWYPVGFTAGYLALLLFVAAPLRRSGAFTLPDFAESRLGSPRIRALVAMLVVFIGWLYLVPQLQGAGLALGSMTGLPDWLGAAVVAVVVVANAITGGMRSVTFAQAVQFWIKLTAIIFPVAFLFFAWNDAGRPVPAPATGPVFAERTTVAVRSAITVIVENPVVVSGTGRVDGQALDGKSGVTLKRGSHRVAADAELVFPAGGSVPRPAKEPEVSGVNWMIPGHQFEKTSATGASDGSAMFAVYSLMLATFLGTMGLPHVLVRFYTNPDGQAARRTTFVVLALLSAFYVFPAIYGVLGRIYVPQLLMTGRTDAAVLMVPSAAVGGLTGQLLGALVAAGAFAAFLSTASGLVVSVAGVLAADLAPARLGPASPRSFRLAAVVAGFVPLAFALPAIDLDISQVVGMAFAVAASSFCPLLVLGIWWRSLTDAGAIAGLAAGGGSSALAVLLAIVLPPAPGWVATLVTQPAAVTVPFAFGVMIIVSLLTRNRIPGDVSHTMMLMHTPERLLARTTR